MWKKTLIRRLTKRLDMSAEDVRRVMDEAEFDGLRDVTPKEPGGFAKKALAARGKDVSGDEGADEAEAPQDAEDAPSEDDSAPHWTEEIDTSDGFPGDDAFTEGNRAYKMGDARTVCPYEDDHEAAASWLAGWGEAKRVEEEMG
jgi:recombination protein RecT